jgi:UDP:flavonoid glycosyltransferase YjiC (YdhE family)
MTLGTVAAAAQMPFFPAVYRAAIDALAALPVRVLVTLGEDADPAALGPPPPNVRLERWVPQEEVLRHAAAVVSHGGYGTTLGALAHGVPLVVVPLFSFDQWMNAAAVERAGAGVALGGNPAERPVFGVPDDEALAAIGPAVERAVGEPGFAAAARRLAAEMEQMPPPAAAVDVLDEIRRGDPLPTRPA